MKFSVVIPCYNCVKTLKNTVASIHASGLRDYEILLIDDGSTDGTATLCDRLSEEYDGVRCIHQSNAGVSAARNRGIDEARGDYIWFVDADDTVEPLDMVRIQESVLEGTDCIMFGMKFLYLWRGKMIMQETMTCNRPLKLTPQNMGIHFRALFEKNYFTAIWNKFIRRSILTENKLYFDCALINYEDLQFSLVLMAHCETMTVLPEPYYRYMNTFGHDRTVDRIQQIPDIIAYTDKIVSPFCELDKKLCATGCSSIDGLSVLILRLYMEAAFFKLKTANRRELKQLCASIQENSTVQKEAHNIQYLSRADRRLYRWLMTNSYGIIRVFMLYRALRGVGGRFYRIGRSFRGSKYEKKITD